MLRFFIIAIGLFQYSAFAAQNSGAVKFYAEAPKSVAVNEQFKVSFKVENTTCGAPTLPIFYDFVVISGPSTENSITSVNGKLSQSATYTYILRPKREGSYQLGKASITVSGINMESNDLAIDVTAAVDHPKEIEKTKRKVLPFGFDTIFDFTYDLKTDTIYSEGPTSVTLSEQFKIKFIIGKHKALSPQLPSFGDFELINGPIISNSTQWTNGNEFTTSVYTYILKPKRKGIFHIGKATIITTGRFMESNDLIIKVTAAGKKQREPKY